MCDLLPMCKSQCIRVKYSNCAIGEKYPHFKITMRSHIPLEQPNSRPALTFCGTTCVESPDTVLALRSETEYESYWWHPHDPAGRAVETGQALQAAAVRRAGPKTCPSLGGRIVWAHPRRRWRPGPGLGRHEFHPGRRGAGGCAPRARRRRMAGT